MRTIYETIMNLKFGVKSKSDSATRLFNKCTVCLYTFIAQVKTIHSILRKIRINLI
jgi:hypothetical protein